MEAEESELDPLWVELERSTFLVEDDDEDKPAEGFNQNEAPKNVGANRGQLEEVRLGSEYIKRGIDKIQSIVTEANLANLKKAYQIPDNVTLRVPTVDDIPSLPHEKELP